MISLYCVTINVILLTIWHGVLPLFLMYQVQSNFPVMMLELIIMTIIETMDELFVQTRRMLLHHPTYKCPSSLHPHVLFVLNQFPTNGAAGKIHHRSLHQIALSNIQTVMEEEEEDDDETKNNYKTPSIQSILRKGTFKKNNHVFFPLSF